MLKNTTTKTKKLTLKFAMRKSVLILLAVGTSVYAGAQLKTSYEGVKPTKPVSISTLHTKAAHPNDAPPFYNQAVTESSAKKGGLHKTQTAGNGVPCGGAHNLYGILNANTTAVTCDQATGSILFTHRADQSKMGSYGSGTYEASYSLDWGQTWDTTLLMYKWPAASASGTRYPNGVMFNPAGNTNFKNAYWIASGPWTDGSATFSAPYGNWDSIAFGSMKLDSTNVMEGYKGNGKPGVNTEEFVEYMSSSDDSTVHNVGDGLYYNSGGTGDTYTGSSINTGKFNGSGFTWNQTLIRPHLMPSTHSMTAFDTLAERMNDAGTAWSQDGKTGYVVIFGNLDSAASPGDTLNFVTYQPIVYKTTDAGKSWNMMLHNWRNDPTMSMWLRPTADSPSVMLPIWHLFNNPGAQGGDYDYDLVVDANNDLHIFGVVCASAIANKDSSAFISYYNRNFLFDCYTTGASWNARFIDSMLSVPTQSINNGLWVATSTGPLAMGNRVQASRSLDGKKVFVTWLDDTIDYVGPTTIDSLQFPDMYGQGYDVTTGKTTRVKSFTHSQTYSTNVWYICVSNLDYTTGSVGNMAYHIPVVRVATPSGTNDGTTAVAFLYDTTDVYYDNDFVGFQELSKPQFSITPSYPNPSNGVTRFGVNMVKEGLVSVDVYNMVGERIITMEPQKMGTGSHTITINANGLANGVYFYRVTVNGQSLSQKMVIEQ